LNITYLLFNHRLFIGFDIGNRFLFFYVALNPVNLFLGIATTARIDLPRDEDEQDERAVNNQPRFHRPFIPKPIG
jgi:hypothetical protein